MKFLISFLTQEASIVENVKFKIESTLKDKVQFINFNKHKEFLEEEIQHICIVIGGDGSLNFAVNKIMSNGVSDVISVCYIPNGTGNDFSRVVGLHQIDINTILNLIRDNKKEKISIGKINENYFINMVSFGLFAEVTPEVNNALKGLLGCWSYYFKGISMLSELAPWSCRFSFDDIENPLDEDILGFFVGNSKFAGGGIQVTGDASPCEDNLDLLIIKNITLSELISLGLELQKDKPDLSGYSVLYKKFRKMKFNSNQEFRASIDGEQKKVLGGSVEVIPKALNIYLP